VLLLYLLFNKFRRKWMSLNYLNLDSVTRQFMREEIDFDKEQSNFYLSNYLSPQGKQQWPTLLEESIQHDDSWLEREIIRRELLAQYHTRRTPSGGTTQARVPVTAAQTLAEGEFNRLYVRGLSARAMASGIDYLEAYRARSSQNPRPESQAIIGRHFLAQSILQDLRANSGVESALGVPPGPNSGISVKLP
jgi:hypothetical protein